MSLFDKYKVIVFDLGGTLMEYVGMPLNWSEYYPEAFRHVNEINKLNLSEEEISKAVEILKSYNPRITKREIEIDPEDMFKKILKSWNANKQIYEQVFPKDNKHNFDINNSDESENKKFDKDNNSDESENKLFDKDNTSDIDSFIKKIIQDFFDGMNLKPVIFDYTKNLIKSCKAHGCKVACLTDLASGMPDYIFREDIAEIVNEFDLYVSSKTCGYRKPNKAGIEYIASKCEVDVKQILLVGDEEKDYNTANNANCDFMFISDFKTIVIK